MPEKYSKRLLAFYRTMIELNKKKDFQTVEDTIEILGVRVNLEDYDSAIAKVEEHINSKYPTGYVTLMSANNLVNAQKYRLFKEISNKTYLSLPDGIPLVWIARSRGVKRIKTNIRGTDFMYRFFERAVQKKYKHFFYGGKEGIADQLKRVFENKFPEVKIVGTYCPPFRQLTEAEDGKIREMINSSGADIVWVGLNTPKQEYWMNEHKGKLNVSLMIGVGAAFDFHTGNAKEAPRWMQSNGLEWIFRLFTEPRRLWRRYLIGNSLLIYWLIKEKFNNQREVEK
ncbi:MAG: WecB/TagA/CpsF family glycosyltransferase [Planctomycetota bacterium]